MIFDVCLRKGRLEWGEAGCFVLCIEVGNTLWK